MADRTLLCEDCGEMFLFTESEQSRYAEKGFTQEPSRCPKCRSAKKAPHLKQSIVWKVEQKEEQRGC